MEVSVYNMFATQAKGPQFGYLAPMAKAHMPIIPELLSPKCWDDRYEQPTTLGSPCFLSLFLTLVTGSFLPNMGLIFKIKPVFHKAVDMVRPKSFVKLYPLLN